MKSPIKIFLLALLAFLQIAVPISMILREEITLRRGTQYKLRTAPVDPYDAFRGRYVALSFEEESVSLSKKPKTGKYGRSVFVTLQTYSDGYARVERLTESLPPNKLAFSALYRNEQKSDLTLTFPFNRFYLEEGKAPRAEAAYRSQSRSENLKTYATIRVLNGHATLEGLYIDDQPIHEYLRTHPPESAP